MQLLCAHHFFSNSLLSLCSCWGQLQASQWQSAAGSPHLREHTLFGPKLHQHSLQVTEVLIISELASTQFAAGGITVGHPNTAAALHILQEDCHHHRHICHVCVVVQFLLEGAQLAR